MEIGTIIMLAFIGVLAVFSVVLVSKSVKLAEEEKKKGMEEDD